ncbi:hypothetical protein Lal_00038293 [Lupinus albus]|nr:hypothetical protein Lal_00038293 [Lupinus albus]
MEGFIPFVYKAIMQYKNRKEGPIGSWIFDTPSYSYMRLPGDSGRFQDSASSPSFNPASSANQEIQPPQITSYSQIRINIANKRWLNNGVDEIDVSENANVNEGDEFDFEEIDFGSLNEDE